MSILGMTLDYGPFGFIDDYDAGLSATTPTITAAMRFNQQPFIGLWNLSCLAQTLLRFGGEGRVESGDSTGIPLLRRALLWS